MEPPGDALINYIFPNNAEVAWSLTIVVYPFITGLMAGAFVVSALAQSFFMRRLLRCEGGDETRFFRSIPDHSRHPVQGPARARQELSFSTHIPKSHVSSMVFLIPIRFQLCYQRVGFLGSAYLILG